MSLLGLYLVFGAGVYAGLSCANFSSFSGASAFSVAKGVLLGFLLWPAGLAVAVTLGENKK